MNIRKILLLLFLSLILAVILLTWGSIGSAALTLALLLSGIYLAARRFRETHDPDDLL